MRKSPQDIYNSGVFFILRDTGKHWPVRSVSQVCGWQMTRQLAHMFDLPVSDVARDVIEQAELLEEGRHGKHRQWFDPDAAA